MCACGKPTVFPVNNSGDLSEVKFPAGCGRIFHVSLKQSSSWPPWPLPPRERRWADNHQPKSPSWTCLKKPNIRFYSGNTNFYGEWIKWLNLFVRMKWNQKKCSIFCLSLVITVFPELYHCSVAGTLELTSLIHSFIGFS